MTGWCGEQLAVLIGRDFMRPWHRSFVLMFGIGDRREEPHGYTYRTILDIELLHPFEWFVWEIFWIDQGRGVTGHPRIAGFRQMPVRMMLHRRRGGRTCGD